MPTSLDFETRSELNLTQVGAEKYARHPSTRVLCASFSVANGPTIQWRPWSGQEMPIPLKKALLTDTEEIHAWNAAFERQILKHVIKLPLAPSRFRCTQARARSMALPAKLEMCARALNMPIQKADNKIMMKWCKPLPGGGYADDRDEYDVLCSYCDVDVLTEQGIGNLLRHLSAEEQRDWEVTEHVNDNGIPIDLQLVRAAQRYASDEMLEIRERLSELTHGVVTSPKQFQRLKEWLAPEIEVESLDASVREELLDDPAIQGDIREVIQLVDDGGRASTAKFAAMENRADSDGRVHGAYIFNGAGQTGRFCVAGDTLIETEFGPFPIWLLQLGDKVLTHKGRFRPVLNLFYKGEEEMYKLHFSGGASIICTTGHRLLTRKGWQHVGIKEILKGQIPLDLQAICPATLSNPGANSGRISNYRAYNSRRASNGPYKEPAYSAQTSQLLSIQERQEEPAIRDFAQEEIGLEERLRRRMERAWLYTTPPQNNDGSVRTEETSELVGSASYRWEQDTQCNGQLCFGDKTWSSILAPRSITKIETVGVRGVWDIEVEEDHSYVAQGLIHHNSSTGAQLHNFIRDKLENTEDVVDAIFAEKPKAALIELAQFPKDYTGPRNILTILSRLLRPSLVAPDGKQLVWGDWKSIEARVLPWLSLENSASLLLELFTTGADVYKHQAAGMFGCTIEEVTDGQRQRGKVAILSLGYGGGANALIAMARNYGLIIDPDTAEMYKRTWRQSNPWAQRFWNTLEAAIYNAVRNPGQVFRAGRVSYMSTEAVLWCLLPCGRMLAYPFPKIETKATRFGMSDQVTCIKGAWSPKKGMNYWPRMSLWGGLAAENITQGVAASLLRWSQRELADCGWLDFMIGHTHDENMLEVANAEVAAAREAMEDVMVTGPDWAAGLPLAVDMMSGAVYGK